MNPTPFTPTSVRRGFEAAARDFDEASSRGSANRQIASAASPAPVEQAIASAAQQTSVDFDFLVAQAQVESAMNPDAQARTSSASGLFQFIESTWLDTMKRHGARFGLGEVAAQIGATQSGSAYVSDPKQREAILAMRFDPQVASLMAAGLAEDNRAHLTPILGRQPDHSELYLAHFLGAGGAGRFLSAMAHDPQQNAADLFRRPAAANRPVFYESTGAPRSLAGVMDFLSAKLNRAMASAPPGASYGFAEPYQAAPLTSAQPAPPPYIIADEAVFGPADPPALAGHRQSAIAARSTLPVPSVAPLSARAQQPMSNVLRATFGENEAQTVTGPESGERIRRAYDQLKAFGL